MKLIWMQNTSGGPYGSKLHSASHLTMQPPVRDSRCYFSSIHILPFNFPDEIVLVTFIQITLESISSHPISQENGWLCFTGRIGGSHEQNELIMYILEVLF